MNSRGADSRHRLSRDRLISEAMQRARDGVGGLARLWEMAGEIEDGADLPICAKCDGIFIRKWGRDRHGHQRYRCQTCLATFSVERTAGNHLPPSKERCLMTALRSGMSIRAAARYAGVARATAHKYSHGVSARCPCGDDARHRGWCSYRVSRSPRRRAFLRLWHSGLYRLSDKEIADTFGLHTVTIRVARQDGLLGKVVDAVRKRQTDKVVRSTS